MIGGERVVSGRRLGGESSGTGQEHNRDQAGADMKAVVASPAPVPTYGISGLNTG